MNGTKKDKPVKGIPVIYDPIGDWYQPDAGKLWICPDGHITKSENLVAISGSITCITCPICLAPEGVDLFEGAK